MIKFLAFTDLHYDYATQGDERIRQIVSRAKDEEVDFIVSLGDITAPFEQYSHVLEKVRSAGLPFYQVLGNHDVQVNLNETLRFLGLKDPYYSLTIGDIKFLFLNTCYYKFENVEHSFPEIKGEGVERPIIPQEEMEWLKKELDGKNDYVIFSHHSFTNQFRNRYVRNRQEVFDLFHGKNVLLCMNGHDHGNDLKMIDHVPFYTLNSAYGPWIGIPSGDEALAKKYGHLNCYVPYDRAFSAVVTIENGSIRIEGIEGDYESVTPAELGLTEPYWNGVSVEPKANSYVIPLDNNKKNLKDSIKRELLGRAKSYKDLAMSFKDISTDVLTETIMRLEQEGIISRSIYAECLPPQANYSLSIIPNSIKKSTNPIKNLLSKHKSLKEENKKVNVDLISISNDARTLFKEKAHENDGKVTVFCRKYGKIGDEILEKTVSIDHMVDDESGFIYIFGVPGPDFNYYSFADYGLTWAISIDDFMSKLKRMHKVTTWGTEYDYYIEDDPSV